MSKVKNPQAKLHVLKQVGGIIQDRHDFISETVNDLGDTKKVRKALEPLDKEINKLVNIQRYIRSGCSPAQTEQLLQALESCSEVLAKVCTKQGLIINDVRGLQAGVVQLIAMYRGGA